MTQTSVCQDLHAGYKHIPYVTEGSINKQS